MKILKIATMTMLKVEAVMNKTVKVIHVVIIKRNT